MTEVEIRVSPQWLELREPADAAARSTALVTTLAAALEGQALEGAAPTLGDRRGDSVSHRRIVVHDLGSGSGSMGRWLGPLLEGPQHWVLHDWDPDLLRGAVGDPPPATTNGGAVTVETRLGDITQLTPEDLGGASLVTASALLDMLTAAEIGRLVGAVVVAACPALLTLSVTGHITLGPSDPWDAVLEAAFNDHQRRTLGDRQLLGPDAARVAADSFRAVGWSVELAASPWCLDSQSAELAAEWLKGWVGAACEQRPELGDIGASYLARRRNLFERGLAVTVQHVDLLALPPGGGR
ncbi:SAM-dependent methyltransferase [Knoellia sp. S7-12]|uniref:SAM-dependent methyltransferase n=1 Tax=Knoellia sp. S7-12 TaxID=3126698 RepID=UPI0033695F3A